MVSHARQKVVILGATGSVGVNTLRVIEQFPERFEVIGLTAYRNVQLLAEQARRFNPGKITVGRREDAEDLAVSLGMPSVQIGFGVEDLIEMAALKDADLVVSSIVGAAGLVPTLAAVNAGKRIALANKETLVMAGRLVMEAAARHGAEIIPVDSEHSAIFQCLAGEDKKKVRRLILTASGGPFYGLTTENMDRVTPEDALRHPKWDMGQKISIDSASLMNKGLEVIEARWLFDIPVDRIQVLVHPQSIVHSMVEFVDGSVLAQMGNPDMRVPISYALSYPDRLGTGLAPLDLVNKGPLTFMPPDQERFPCLSLAYEAINHGGLMPAVLNAANEVAVEAFLDMRLGFLEIAEIIRKTMSEMDVQDYTTVEDVLRTDLKARKVARGFISEQVKKY
ncbi:MAG: 1-deoxy-D-xylulose-5-phosphate reductoisomerase [bacterium]